MPIDLGAQLAAAAVDGASKHMPASEAMALARDHERALAMQLARKHGHPAVILTESTLDLNALAVVDKDEAQRLGILPLAKSQGELTAVVGDVEAFTEADSLSYQSGLRLKLYVGVGPLIDETRRKAYELVEAGHDVLVGNHSPQRAPHLALERPQLGEAEETVRNLLASLSGPLAQLRKSAEVRQSAEGEAVVEPAAEPAAAPTSAPAPAPGQMHTEGELPPKFEEMFPKTDPGLEKARIVVIEDEEAIRKLITRLLEKDGYTVLEAADGEAGVALLREGRPDLVITDAMLPWVHGFEICSRIKHSGWSDVPVILVTAVYKGLDHAREVQEVHGADAFIEKPFPVRLLREVVARHLGRTVERQELSKRARRRLDDIIAELDLARTSDNEARLLDLLTERLRLDPFDAHTHHELGCLLEKRGDPAGALTSFERAHIYDPHFFEGATRLAATYGNLGFVRRSTTLWRHALKLAPDDLTREGIEHVLSGLERAGQPA